MHAGNGQLHQIDKSRQLQRQLYLAAKKCRERRFHALYDRIFRPDVLWRAWQEVKANGGSAGVDGVSLEEVEREAGWDMSKWKTEHHFVSWLRLCPDNKISGDKIIGKGRWPTNNRVTNALRMAASTLRLSNTYLGAQFRRLRTKLGAPVAIKAMAAKLARLVYRMLRYGMTFIDRGAEFYDAQHRKLQINYLKRKAANFGFQIIEAPAV